MKLVVEKKTCFHCGRRLAPQYKYTEKCIKDENGYSFRMESERTGIRGYGYGSNGLFCTLNCGFEFAVKVAKRALELKEIHE